ncbi:MAG: ATP-dependent helicase HelY [Actinomycetota bacterium]
MQASPFALDAYQRVAIDHLDSGHSVVVCAPTGAGKTLIAEHAIRAALARGQTAVYTTPLKALSNQKRADLARTTGVMVGLMTGDRVDSPDAPVVVMTTEVLRALLLSDAALVQRVGVIVLDEFHWIQDPQRGGVWEEVVIAAPAGTTLVCLSATLPSAPAVCDWMAQVHGPTDLVEEGTRPVELTHLYALGNPRRDPPALVPLFDGDRPNPTAELLDGVRVRRGDDSPLRRRERDRNRPVTPERLDLLDELRRDHKLPAIWFLLSRAGCDNAVTTYVEARVRLTTADEAHAVRALAHDATAAMSDEERRAIEFDSWLDALTIGVAAHHGALAPVQREVVEVAFARELVKVVFATETLAVGVNLPARSVVIDRVVRPQRQGGGTLSVGEFAQLSGRAGRRGIDDSGYVVIPWSPDASFAQLTALVKGRLPTLTSRFRPTPAMVAAFVSHRDPAQLQRFVHSSLRASLAARHVADLRDDLEVARQRVRDAGSDSPETASDEPVTLEHLRPGDVIVDPGRTYGRPAVVVGSVRRRRDQETLEVVGEDGRRTTMTARSLRAAPVVVAQIELPAEGRSPRGFTRQVADLLRTAECALALPSPRATPPPRAGGARRARAEAGVELLEERIANAETELDDELAAYVALLRRRGHLEAWDLEPSGVALSRLFHDAGLLVAEALRAALFDGLSAAEVAAFASGFKPRSAHSEHAFRAPTPKVGHAYRVADDLVRELNAVEHDLDLPLTPSPNGAVYRWAETGNLGHALRGTEARAGDLVREARQVAELVEQLALVGDDALRRTCADAAARLNRGIVVDELPPSLRAGQTIWPSRS